MKWEKRKRPLRTPLLPSSEAPPGLLAATEKISGLYELRSSPRTIPPPDLLTATEKSKRTIVVTHSVTPEIATALADAPTLATTAITASAPWQITYMYHIYIYISER